MNDYPVPRHAVSIWLAGDRLWAAFPPLSRGEHGHSVPFPNSERGLTAILLTLRSRTETSTVGTRSSPCKHDMEVNLSSDQKFNEWLKAMKVTEEDKTKAEEFLKELGL